MLGIRLFTCGFAAASLLACGPQVGVNGDDGAGTEGGSGSSASVTATGPMTGPSSASGPTTATSGPTTATGPGPTAGTSGGTADDGETGLGFIIDPDGGSLCAPLICDLWQQDCARGEKCTPAACGSTTWNSSRCGPIDANPDGLGDRCTVTDSPVSGIDSCALGQMCWDVDLETFEGRCVSLCQGSELDPTCPGPGTTCVIANQGALPLCLQSCDPIVQDCAPGSRCSLVDEQFVCVPHFGTDGPFGLPCAAESSCALGLFCAPAADVPGCQGGSCCNAWCDLDDAMADETCPGFAQGQRCRSAFAGTPPQGSEHIGVCTVP